MKVMKLFLSIFITIIFFLNPVFSCSQNNENKNYNQQTFTESNILIGPYLQNPSTSSITIIWKTYEKTSENIVKYGLTTNCDTTIDDNTFTDFHKFTLYKLDCDTKYYYRVISDGFTSDLYSFTTKPKENEEIKFITYGDTRGVWDNWYNASVVADAIEKEKPLFVLHTGDLVHNGNNKEEWIDFFNASDFIHNSTLYPVLGNHEYYGEPYSEYFPELGNGYWYSFDYSGVHIIGLDSNVINVFNLKQITWLIKDLKQNKDKIKVVMFHHPPYSSGRHGSSYHLRFIWGPILQIFNVQIVFNGHDHSYEHGIVRNTHYIVSGGGGAPLYDTGDNWWTEYSEKTYHYCLMTFNEDLLTFESKKPDGAIIDSFQIEI